MLKWFGENTGEAKRAYWQFVKDGMDQGHRSDLIGGGLMRSQGGWAVVKDMIRQGIREKSDERILGSGEFVRQLIQQSDEERRKQFFSRENHERAIEHSMKECKDAEVDSKALKAGSRRRTISEIRARLIEKLVEVFGFSPAEAGRQ